MTLYELISTSISLISLVIAIIAILRTSKDAAHSTAVSGHGLKVTQGQAEVELRNMITDSRTRVEDFYAANAEFLDRDIASLSEEEKKKRNHLKTYAKTAVEGYLSALDTACGKYLDPGKSDKIRFKKDYQREVRQTVQSEAYASYFRTGHAFNALMTVYEEWENPEKA